MSEPEPKKAPLGLMRLKDRNEALGLAVRLLAWEKPFRDLPLGMSAGALVDAIDNDRYFFATRDDVAVGVTYWIFLEPEVAENWLFKGQQLAIEDAVKGGSAAVALGMRAVEASATRFLFRNLRDVAFAENTICYYLRTYPNGQSRAVRLIRPHVSRGGAQ